MTLNIRPHYNYNPDMCGTALKVDDCTDRASCVQYFPTSKTECLQFFPFTATCCTDELLQSERVSQISQSLPFSELTLLMFEFELSTEAVLPSASIFMVEKNLIFLKAI